MQPAVEPEDSWGPDEVVCGGIARDVRVHGAALRMRVCECVCACPYVSASVLLFF